MTQFRHCQQVFPDGHTCGSAAVTGRDYCYHHLSHRGRRIRIARARSENRRLCLDLPPLDSLSAIHAAAAQIVEALAADVIEVRHAQAMLSGLCFMARTIPHADKPAWHHNAYHNEQPRSYDNFESDFDLPANFDLHTPPEVAFPVPDASQAVILSEGDAPCAPPKSKDPFASPYRTGTAQTTTDNLPDPPSLPYSGNYCADHQSRECDCMLIRADFPVTPENVEILEVSETLGSDAAAIRARQLDRNRQRRQLRTDRKRYAARAQELNIRRAAEILAQRKLAAQKLAEENLAPDRAQSQEVKCPTAAPIGEAEVGAAFHEDQTQPPKKPVARSEDETKMFAGTAVKSSA